MLQAALTLLALFAVSRIYKLWSGLKTVGYVPGIRCALGARSYLSLFLPTRLSSFFYNPGPDFTWEKQRTGGFEEDVVSVVPWLQGSPAVVVSSMETMQQVLGHPDDFDKLTNDPGTIIFGTNVVTLQKEAWKKHRRVVHPAFSNKLYLLVWKESMRMFRDMVDTEGWDKKQSVDIPLLNDLTSKFTINIVASCAFDFHSTWSDSIASAGNEMTLQKCLKVVLADAPLRLLAPKWAYYVFPFGALKRVDTAFSTIHRFMRAQIALRREKIVSEDVTSEDTQGQDTIFNNIVKANVDGGKFAFDEEEVIGNTFIMLFAGHETTARTLNGLLPLLALYQDEQEKVYQEIKQVLPDGRDPTFEDFESFAQIRKCIQEAMRIYPPLGDLTREAMHDVQLDVTNKVTGKKDHSVVIKKGTQIIVNIVGIHYNPRHFPDPETFKPSRWDDGSVDPDAFGGFGQGPRACIGRKFSLAEATCFVAMLLRDWRVEVDLAEGETPQQWQRRVMTGGAAGLRGLGPISVRFARRKSQ
ncbi:hypothetical protein BOTBODRAFT_179710 [Botryobasidium botryosum FD-172 SS1]|uniref:Cytochrome P450 n=1 Tax=Botryobasidium botryosum (strain FD-172 SS1) TaxID=930990 RepID=A0A067MAK3_BOTB1|nr:hypothetical protein BOTBODRAFT_179710 [Botryobasidium botryosum FD-172 SS1]